MDRELVFVCVCKGGRARIGGTLTGGMGRPLAYMLAGEHLDTCKERKALPTDKCLLNICMAYGTNRLLMGLCLPVVVAGVYGILPVDTLIAWYQITVSNPNCMR